MTSPWRAWSRLSLSAKILTGLGLGVVTGLFLGEPAANLQPLGDIYIRLMQMTVLPYLIAALVVAFGQLAPGEAKRLAVRGGLLLLLVWAVMIVVLTAVPFAFPDIVSASFYSSALVEPPQDFSLAEIYFTSNPFESLSRNVVPAVVLFSCLLGVALMGLEDKARLLDPLRVWNEAVVRITHMVIALTPYGVFCIVASTAGTMDLETFVRLEAYFVAFAAVSLLLGFVILPLMVTAMTPFSYREVVGVAKDALLTAFVAQNAFIVMPILIERSKALFEKHGLLDERSDSAADVMIPVLFNFPNAGKLLTLLFIPFAAWLAGTTLGLGDYPSLFAAGIPSYFAKAQIALPFLLDLFSLPHDLFLLYIPTTIVTGKFDSMVTAMNLLVFALLGAGAMAGFLKLDAGRLLRAGGLMAVATLATVIGVRAFLAATIDADYDLDQRALAMQLPAELRAFTVLDAPPPGDASGVGGGAILKRIQERGSLRIGFDPGNLPFTFFNSQERLVGLDVELSLRLARGLGVEPVFVPVDWSRLPEMLDTGVIDVMPGVWYRPNWFGRLHFSEPYMKATVGFAVRDERRHEFSSVEALHQSEGLTIGVPLDVRQLGASLERYLGEAAFETKVVEFWKPYFEGAHPDLDAFLMPVEHASGWSLLHPGYTAVVPQPDPIRISVAFGVARGSEELARTIDEWITVARDTGTVDLAYRNWVLGQGATRRERRWSVMHDVLGWEWGR